MKLDDGKNLITKLVVVGVILVCSAMGGRH